MPRRTLKFTADDIKALQPESKPYRVYDTQEAHLGLEVLPSGRKRFFVRRRPEPHAPPRQWNLGEWLEDGEGVSVAKARGEARIIDGEITRGEVDDKPQGMRLKAFWEDFYSVHHLPKLAASSQRNYREAWKMLKPIHHKRIDEIRKAHYTPIHIELGQKSPAMANKARAVLSSILGYAIELDLLEQRPPLPRPYRLKKRERWLDKDDLRRYFAALREEPTWAQHYMLLAIFTGARKREVCAMRWDEIDYQRAIWRRLQKGNTVAPTALADICLQVIGERAWMVWWAAAWKARQTDFLCRLVRPGPFAVRPAAPDMIARLAAGQGPPWAFPSRGKTGHLVEPKKRWQSVRDRAELTNVVLHTLRHTLATWVTQVSDQKFAQWQLGHAQLSTTDRYTHVANDPLRDVVNKAVGAMIGEEK